MTTFVIVIAYLVLTFVLGVLPRLRTKNTSVRKFFVADGTMTLFAVTTMLFGDLIAASTTTGTAGTGYSTGVSALWGIWGSSFGCIIFSTCFCKFFFKIRETGAMTGPVAFGLRFNEGVRYLVLIFTLIPLFIIFSTQITASSMYFSSMLGLDSTVSTVIVFVLFLAMALLGISGVAEMNKVHSFVIFFGLTFSAIVCVNYVGGGSALITNLPEGHLNLFVNGVPTVLAQFLGGALGFSISTTSIAIAFCSKDNKVAHRSHFIVAVVSALFALAPMAIGLCAAVSLDGIRPDTALYAMTSLVDPRLAGLAVMAVFAAIFSTGPWFLLSAAQLVIRELYYPYIRKRNIPTSDKRQLMYSRMVIVIMLIGAVAISGTNASLLNSLMSAAQIKAISVVLLLFGIYWKRTTNKAGFAGLLVGGTLSTIWYILGNPFGVQPLWIGLLSSSLIIVIGSLVECRQPVSSDYLAFEKRVAKASVDFKVKQQQEVCQEQKKQ